MSPEEKCHIHWWSLLCMEIPTTCKMSHMGVGAGNSKALGAFMQKCYRGECFREVYSFEVVPKSFLLNYIVSISGRMRLSLTCYPLDIVSHTRSFVFH